MNLTNVIKRFRKIWQPYRLGIPEFFTLTLSHDEEMEKHLGE
jgi:hypothetical protein